MRETDTWQTVVVPALSRRRLYFFCKRLMDLLLSAVALIALAPLMLLIALAIRLDSPGPVFFVQERLGLNGRPFRFFKFRTMYHNADHEVHQQYVRSFIRDRLGAGPLNRSSSWETSA